MENILLINKPKGITSFDVIRVLRKRLNIKKMGHAGTLDPLASGLMIVGIGNGTKKLKDFIGLPKTYEADILFGIKTDTGDITGKILEEADVDTSIYQNIDKEKIKDVLSEMVGVLKLPIPAYSAIKRGGESLYKKARRGEKFVLSISEMEIISVNFIEFKKTDNQLILKTEFSVSSGTYIRSIAEEIGKRLGAIATLKELKRTKIGKYDIKDATTI
jgi:tRNA pseudouridine55 synthase